jgi:hypothetical protein
MKLAMVAALALIAVVNASDAGALTYILVDSHGQERYLNAVPQDMTYPPGRLSY